jgi:hypothetical protein
VDAVAFLANVVVQAVQVLNQHGADLKSKFNLNNSKEQVFNTVFFFCYVQCSVLISIFSETTFSSFIKLLILIIIY